MKAPNIIVVYSNPFRFENTVYYPHLIVKAKNKFEFYTPYHYCTSNISKSPIQFIDRSIYTKDHASEWLTRFRRAIYFFDVTKLKPVRCEAKKFEVLKKRVLNTRLNSDHMSCLVSVNGTKFIMIEPYHIEPDFESICMDAGLSILKLDSDIAPYSGSWNNKIGQESGTTSFIICDIRNEPELCEIDSNINSSRLYSNFIYEIYDPIIQPSWNSLEGIIYV